jgi:3-hydroxyacyl-[acyl-carrier-protein] dehydratase
MNENPSGNPPGKPNDPAELGLPHGYPEITRILPHRYPFLLVDRVVAVEPGVRIEAYKNVTANEAFFQGHFPDHPVMPGVLQLEALAQSAALLTYYTTPDAFDGKIAYLTGMDNVKFRKLVQPGDRLTLVAEIEKFKRGICKARCRATVDGERASEAIITAFITDRPEVSAAKSKNDAGASS